MLTRNKLFYYINSEDRIPGGTDSSFSYKIDIPAERYDQVCLVGATIPKSYYLIPEGANTFYLEEDGKQLPMEMPVGNYNRRSFASVVSDMLNAKSPNRWKYEITYPKPTQADTGKFTFRCLSSANGSKLIMPQRNQSRIYEQFGFEPGSVNSFFGGYLMSTNVLKYVTNDSIFVRSNLCNNSGTNVLHGLSTVGTESYANISYECPHIESYAKELSTSKGNVYTFSITDEDGHVLNFNNLPVLLYICIYASDTTFDLIKQAIGLYSSQIA